MLLMTIFFCALVALIWTLANAKAEREFIRKVTDDMAKRDPETPRKPVDFYDTDWDGMA